jgi:hypothetical protein
VLSWYNGFSPVQRESVQRFLNQEWNAGRLPRPTQCIACEQTEGAIHGHLENYDQPQTFVALCITCHLVLHCRFRQAQVWLDYVDHIAAGWQAPPQDQRNAFGNLRRTGGILSGVFDGGRWREGIPPDASRETYLNTLPLTRQLVTR